MLAELAALNVFHFMLVFARLGSAFMFMPPYAATYITRRARLFIAFGITLAAYPMVSPDLPPMPDEAVMLFALFGIEVLTGIFVALCIQVVMSILQIAGTIIGFASGLMMAQSFDPATANQGSLVAGMLGEFGIVMLFALGLHVVFVIAAIDSYTMLPPGAPPMVGDMASTLINLIARAFVVAWQLSAPFVVYSIVFHSMLGILARLMPTMNVLFVALPLQILLALGLLSLVLPYMLLTAMGEIETQIMGLFGTTR